MPERYPQLGATDLARLSSLWQSPDYAVLDNWAALKNDLPQLHLMNVPFAAHEAIKEQPEMVWAAVQAFQHH